jgi:hypothetical protein
VDGDRSQTSRRVTVAEAARLLDTTGEAIRSRIKRGKLRSVKEGSTVYVLLRPDQTPPEQGPDADQATDQTRPDALLEAKDETIALLRMQLEAERQAHAEARRLLMAALERIPPQLEPPPREEARGSPESPGPTETPTEAARSAQERREASGMHMPEAGGGPLPHDQQTPSERPWWRRVFGG